MKRNFTWFWRFVHKLNAGMCKGITKGLGREHGLYKKVYSNFSMVIPINFTLYCTVLNMYYMYQHPVNI